MPAGQTFRGQSKHLATHRAWNHLLLVLHFATKENCSSPSLGHVLPAERQPHCEARAYLLLACHLQLALKTLGQRFHPGQSQACARNTAPTCVGGPEELGGQTGYFSLWNADAAVLNLQYRSCFLWPQSYTDRSGRRVFHGVGNQVG